MAYKILVAKHKKETQMVTLTVDKKVISHPTEIAQNMLDGLLPDDTEDDTDELRDVRRLADEPVTDWVNMKL